MQLVESLVTPAAAQTGQRERMGQLVDQGLQGWLIRHPQAAADLMRYSPLDDMADSAIERLACVR